MSTATRCARLRAKRGCVSFVLFSMVAAGQSAATIPAAELLHPAPGKARNLLNQASHFAATGQIAREMHSLREGLRDAQVAPYALKALGIRHLQQGLVSDGVDEMLQATRFLPWDSQLQGMIAYGEYLSGNRESARERARTTLAMNRHEPAGNLVLGLLLLRDLTEKRTVSKDEESILVHHLRKAVPNFPGAHVVLWDFYLGTRQTPKAEREMAEYDRVKKVLRAEDREQIAQWIDRVSAP